MDNERDYGDENSVWCANPKCGKSLPLYRDKSDAHPSFCSLQCEQEAHSLRENEPRLRLQEVS